MGSRGTAPSVNPGFLDHGRLRGHRSDHCHMPPRRPGWPAGLYDLRVTARGGGVDAETLLQVQITGSFDMQLTTPDQRLNADVTAGQPTQFPVVVFNTGSADLST